MSKYVPPSKRNTKVEPAPQRVEEPEVVENHYNIKFDSDGKGYLEDKNGNRKELPSKLSLDKNQYPSLGNTTVTSSTRIWSKPFVRVTEEFKTKSEEEKQKQEEERKEKLAQIKYEKSQMQLPHISNIRHYVEPEDEDEDYEQEPEHEKEQQPNSDDEWVTVKKKLKRKLTIEEKLARPPTPEETTDWDNQNEVNEYETCWEDKN